MPSSQASVWKVRSFQRSPDSKASSGADQKVSKTQQSDELQQLQVAKVANPLIDMVAFKAPDWKHTKSELVGTWERAKVDIDQATQQLDARKKLAEDQQKQVMVWKEAAEDARKNKRAADSAVTASAKKWMHCQMYWRWRGHTMKKK